MILFSIFNMWRWSELRGGESVQEKDGQGSKGGLREEAVGIRNHECKDVYKGIRSITDHEKIIIQLILTVKAAFV